MWPRNVRVCDVFCDLFANCDRFVASALKWASESVPPPFAIPANRWQDCRLCSVFGTDENSDKECWIWNNCDVMWMWSQFEFRAIFVYAHRHRLFSSIFFSVAAAAGNENTISLSLRCPAVRTTRWRSQIYLWPPPPLPNAKCNMSIASTKYLMKFTKEARVESTRCSETRRTQSNIRMGIAGNEIHAMLEYAYAR